MNAQAEPESIEVVPEEEPKQKRVDDIRAERVALEGINKLENLESDDFTVNDTAPDGTTYHDLYWTLFVDPDKQDIKKPTLNDYCRGLAEWDIPHKEDGFKRYRVQFIWWRDKAIDADYIRLWIRVVGLSALILSPPFRCLGDDGPDGDRVGDLIELAYATREMGNTVVENAHQIQEERDRKNSGRNLIDRAIRTAEMRELIRQGVSHYGPLTAGSKTAGHQRDTDVLRSGRKTYNG